MLPFKNNVHNTTKKLALANFFLNLAETAAFSMWVGLTNRSCLAEPSAFEIQGFGKMDWRRVVQVLERDIL